jgi:hypothetical protein
MSIKQLTQLVFAVIVAAGLLSSAQTVTARAFAANTSTSTHTIEVSLSTQLTTGTAYDRNPSFLKAAHGPYYLFFARSVTDPCVRPACSADNSAYNIFYKTSTNGQSWTAPVQLSDRSGLDPNFYGRTIAATQDKSGKIWVFWASGGNGGPLYYYTYSGGTWSTRNQVTGLPNDGLYFNVEAVATDDGKVWIFYEDATGAGIFSRSYNGTTWSAPAMVAAGMSIPKAIVDGHTFRLVMVDAAIGQDYITSSTNGTTWAPPTLVAAASGSVTNWDPMIFKDASGKYNIFFAPDLGNGAQRIGWTQSSNGTTWSGANYAVTAGRYGANTWWDYWPEAGAIGGNTYLFYTSEKNGTGQGSGHIWVTKVDWPYGRDHYEAIQPAVDAAAPNDTVDVASGTYAEQISITQPLTVQGAGADRTVIRPTSVTANTSSLSSGAPMAAIVLADGAHGVTVGNLTVDGSGAAYNACSPGYIGIFYRAAWGAIQSTHVTNILQPAALGCQPELGIFVQSGSGGLTSNVLIDSNTVDRYGKNGITANEDGTAVFVTHNVVKGRGPVGSGDAAQNGVQIGFAAKGYVSGNTIRDNYYTPPTDEAYGLLFYEAGDHDAKDNSFRGNERNIGDFPTGAAPAGASSPASRGSVR